MWIRPLLFILGFAVMFTALNLMALFFQPAIAFHGRLAMNDTFYKQNTQINAVLRRIGRTSGPKVIALGDSTLYGAIVNTNQTIPYALGRILKTNGQAVPVYNLAYPGARPADLYAMLKETAPLKPNLIVMDVNVVFFSQTILNEAALADPNMDKEFLFERTVPHGVFDSNRVEEALRIFMRESPIGQNKDAILQRVFGQDPHRYLANLADRYQDRSAKSVPAAPPPDIMGKSWHQRQWGAAEQKTMARIYTQGPLTPGNDSVKMLNLILDYAASHHLRILFYLAPQNDTLIGKFFSLAQLHANEAELARILQDRGAWAIDLSHGYVPEADFGDYDHMLKPGNTLVAQALWQAMRRKGWQP